MSTCSRDDSFNCFTIVTCVCPHPFLDGETIEGTTPEYSGLYYGALIDWSVGTEDSIACTYLE